MDAAGPGNPLVFALFHARGGWRGHLLFSLLVGTIVGGLMILSIKLSGPSWRGTCMNWTMGLLVAQAITLGLATMLGIGTVMRQDLTSGMMDSLRLMRVSPAGVMAGYTVGGGTIGLAIFLPCFIAGCFAAEMGGLGMGPFAWRSLLLTSTTGVLIVFSTAAGFTRGKVMGAVGVLLSLVVVPISIPLSLVCPPLALLGAPWAGLGVMAGASARLEPALLLSLASQAGLATICFLLGCRRYREPGRIAMRLDLSCWLLVLWSTSGMVAMLLWDMVGPSWNRREGIAPAHFVGTLAPALLIGSLPAIRGVPPVDRRGANGPAASRWWWVALACAGLAAAPALITFRVRPDAPGRWPGPETPISFIAAAAWFVFLAGTLRTVARRSIGVVVVAILLLLAVFVGPALLQWAISAFDQAQELDHSFMELPHVVQYCPIGALTFAWSAHGQGASFDAQLRHEAWTGTAVLAALALVAALCAATFGGKGQRRAALPGVVSR